MPSFFADSMNAFRQCRELMFIEWQRTTLGERIMLALAIVCIMMVVGSKSDRTGWSAVMFLTAFGLFAYVLVIGYSMMKL